MKVTDYSVQQLLDGLKEYRQRLAVSEQGDKRYSQTKQNILFDKAMLTLFETELSSRIPF